MRININVDIKLHHYRMPFNNEWEQYNRAHTQNILNRAAFRFVLTDALQEVLLKHVKTEFLLEGLDIPKSITFGKVNNEKIPSIL